MLGPTIVALDFTVAVLSWCILHPYWWINANWSTLDSYGWYDVLIKPIIIHTMPLIYSSINYFFLSDAIG